MRVLIATHNPDKISEIEKIFRDSIGEDIEFVKGIDPGDVVEDGDTLEENAMIKANAWLDINQDCIVVSDDTGFFVDALNGEPGINAAIYAGDHASYTDNVDKVMRELGDNKNRKAHFTTCAIAVMAGSASIVANGTIEGLIAKTIHDGGKFGYDPIFIPSDDEDGQTFSDLGVNVKNMISHRAKAFRALAIGIKNAGW